MTPTSARATTNPLRALSATRHDNGHHLPATNTHLSDWHIVPTRLLRVRGGTSMHGTHFTLQANVHLTCGSKYNMDGGRSGCRYHRFIAVRPNSAIHDAVDVSQTCPRRCAGVSRWPSDLLCHIQTRRMYSDAYAAFLPRFEEATQFPTSRRTAFGLVQS